MTFTGLQEKTKLSSSTLTDHLKKLERIGYIDRSGDPRVIKLSLKASSPVHRTLRNVASISPLHQLDITVGAEYLTEKTKNTFLVVSTLILSPRRKMLIKWKAEKPPIGLEPLECVHPVIFECYKEREDREARDAARLRIEMELGDIKSFQLPELKKLEIDEYYLLKALGRFYFELCFFEALKREDRDTMITSALLTLDFRIYDPRKHVLNSIERIIQLLRERIEDPELFPAFGVVKRMGTLKQFNGILDWIRPLIEFPGPCAETLMLWKTLTRSASRNLAARVFWQEVSDYFQGMLFPLWLEKLQSPTTEQKEKGGEKS
jgi:hypothetical protein